MCIPMNRFVRILHIISEYYKTSAINAYLIVTNILDNVINNYFPSLFRIFFFFYC